MELTVNQLRRYSRGKSKIKYVILVHYNNIVKYIAKKFLLGKNCNIERRFIF